jgi:ABC-type glycerol-3-phosphate transport system substrate-binding protein
MKRLFAMVLVLVAVLAVCGTAMADNGIRWPTTTVYSTQVPTR